MRGVRRIVLTFLDQKDLMVEGEGGITLISVRNSDHIQFSSCPSHNTSACDSRDSRGVCCANNSIGRSEAKSSGGRVCGSKGSGGGGGGGNGGSKRLQR